MHYIQFERQCARSKRCGNYTVVITKGRETTATKDNLEGAACPVTICMFIGATRRWVRV